MFLFFFFEQRGEVTWNLHSFPIYITLYNNISEVNYEGFYG
jgi:hypothetical protein